MNKKIKYSVGGLFSGVGGFELGFSKAGFDTKWAIENDPDAAKTYRHNFSNHILTEKDVKKITSKEIKSLPDIDVLLAGFPCQAFSIAGYRKGFKDPRGNLFDEIIRFVEELQKKPKVLVLETWKYVSQAITAHNYSQVPMILNTSSSTGIPQNRERAYIVCFDNEAKVEYEIQKLNNKKNIAHSDLDYYEGTKSSQFLSHLKKNLLTERKTLDKFLENNVQDKGLLIVADGGGEVDERSCHMLF